MNINKEQFFDGFRDFYKRKRGVKTFPAKAASSVEFLVDKFNSTSQWKDIRHVAYALATIAHETAWTFAPIEEYGKGRGKSYGRPDSVTGQTYYGRGYVQLTWKDNYSKAGKKLGVDLVRNPTEAMNPEVAFKILTKGMFEGWFAADKAGVRQTLERYINDTKKDYKGARRIINGQDRADLIAGYAKELEKIIANSLDKGNKPVPLEDTEPPTFDEVPNVEEPIDNYPEDPKPGEETPDSPAEPGQPVVGGRPGDPPKELEAVEPVPTSGWGAWAANIKAQWASLGIGGFSLGSLTFLTNPLFIKIALGLLAVAIIVSVTVYITTLVIKSKEKRDREQRAHELTLKQMELAADPTKYNVRVTEAKSSKNV